MAKIEKIGRIDCSGDEPLTQQNERDACDINIIMESVRRGVAPSHLARSEPYYGSTVDAPTLREALTIVNNAKEAFASLDARVRDRFANDPVKLCEFLQDSSNYDEAVKLGLCVPKAPVEPSVEPNAVSSSKPSKPKASKADDDD